MRLLPIFTIALLALSNSSWGLEVYRADRPSREISEPPAYQQEPGNSPTFGTSTPYSRSIDKPREETLPYSRKVDEEPRPGERQIYRTKNGSYRSKLNDNYFRRQEQGR